MRIREWAQTLAIIVLIPAGSYANCETVWVPLMGKGQVTHLQVEQGWPLLHFVKNQPYWFPSLPSKPAELEWHPLSRLASVESLGHFGGYPLYEIAYSPAYRVIAWDQSDWSFCPLAIVAGNASIVSQIYQPERFMWENKEILHLRIEITGTGHLQESHFFSVVNGSLVHLRTDWDAVWRYRDTNHIKVFHRGGGFCKGTLTWGNRAWKEDEEGNPVEHGGFFLRADFMVEGNRLLVQRIDLVDTLKDVPKPCELYPR